ncbi:hypothetical protein B0H16DRAFT_1619272 [Mycena metata]|uniref:ARM repeat-containing protein n=1 Tax=Mycena metata TaxID=1033252 RepID=A0AAD7H7W6_9AGAR|nr:hypothetical protein B0H16DRAFT_1619272 [Mycena metata]
MYHRQAAGIIAENAGSTLSAETAEILTTYLTFKDIFPSTRVLVLDHLGFRARTSMRDAQTIIDSQVLGCVPELLLLSDPHIPRTICDLLGSLAQHDKLKAAMRGLEFYPQVVLLLSHKSSEVQLSAANAIIGLDMVEPLLPYLLSLDIVPTTQAHIPQALRLRADLDYNKSSTQLIAERASTLLGSANPNILRLACSILLSIIKHEGPIEAIDDVGLKTAPFKSPEENLIDTGACELLVPLLRHPDIDIEQNAMRLLAYISASSERGADTIEDAIRRFLESGSN